MSVYKRERGEGGEERERREGGRERKSGRKRESHNITGADPGHQVGGVID